ncbi:MAG: IS30 family transposase [Actinomycetales bacterium]|nr:IS30 family transposase [Actinomycetales bacterium]
MTYEQKQMVRRLHAKGLSIRAIAKEIGYTPNVVFLTAAGNQLRPGRPDEWTPRPGRLRAEEREDIWIGIRRGDSLSAIARQLGRSPSTISREVAKNGGADDYGPWRAHWRASQQVRRPRPSKLTYPPPKAQVTTWLEELWSPQEISARLRVEFPEDSMMRVSHETIYRSLFVQGRGELRRELTRCLRSGRRRRRPQGIPKAWTTVTNKVMISERPAEVDDRAVPGHWEGDLIVGALNKSAVGTLVERTTRLVLLLHLPNGKSATDVELAMKRVILTLPEELRRSITWDQGTEMATHVNFTVDTNIPIYFCDPHAPWQRGTNENTNGLLRQYLPKGTDLSQHTEEDLQRIQRSLNGRPRRTLGYMTPLEKFAELVALTT